MFPRLPYFPPLNIFSLIFTAKIMYFPVSLVVVCTQIMLSYNKELFYPYFTFTDDWTLTSMWSGVAFAPPDLKTDPSTEIVTKL